MWNEKQQNQQREKPEKKNIARFLFCLFSLIKSENGNTHVYELSPTPSIVQEWRLEYKKDDEFYVKTEWIDKSN